MVVANAADMGAALSAPDLAPGLGVFEPCKNVEARFPGAKSLVLHKLIWKYYVVHRSKDVHWMIKRGERSIRRHPLNNRDVSAVLEEIVQIILKDGVLPAVSSRAILKEEAGGETYLAVGAGTRSDGFYIAKERHPRNAQILSCLESGFEDCVILHERTPDDVIHFLVNHHNNFHLGSPQTYIQGCCWENMT